MPTKPGTSRRRKGDLPDERCFLLVNSDLKVGVELSSGRPWVGVDQQVGHYSADALFALTDAQYTSALTAGWFEDGFPGKCWEGQHPERLLFHPARGSLRDDQWRTTRSRVLPPRFAGELFCHLDALGEPVDGEQASIVRRLAGSTSRMSGGADGVQRIEIALLGEGAYPRPGALIAGLAAGSDRAAARAVLGEPVDASADVFTVEGARVELVFTDEGLTAIVLEPAAVEPLPGGALGRILGALGLPEEGEKFTAVASLFGARTNRRMSGDRRQCLFESGAELELRGGKVLGVSAPLSTTATTGEGTPELLPGVAWQPIRAQLRGALGAPADTRDDTDLHHFGDRQLLVKYGIGTEGETATSLTAVLTGETAWRKFPPWWSGDVTRFLDVLGRTASDPLVAYVRALPDVRVRLRGDVVTAVELDGRTADFAGFVEGLPAVPRRADIAFCHPDEYGEHDDLWNMRPGWLHVRAGTGGRVENIRVCQERPVDIAVRPWRFGHDSMKTWRSLSG